MRENHDFFIQMIKVQITFLSDFRRGSSASFASIGRYATAFYSKKNLLPLPLIIDIVSETYETQQKFLSFPEVQGQQRFHQQKFQISFQRKKLVDFEKCAAFN
jgi:hypothetical protein